MKQIFLSLSGKFSGIKNHKTIYPKIVAHLKINSVLVKALFFSCLLTPVFTLHSQTTSVTFATAGNFTWLVPAGATSATIKVWGGGGGSGGLGTALAACSGGAGGGAWSQITITPTPSATYNLTVGAGGAGGAATGTIGIVGGSSYFGNTTAGVSTGASVLAVGGSPSAASNGAGTAGAGGLASACTGTLKANGGTGAVATTNSGGGGSSASSNCSANIASTGGLNGNNGTGATGGLVTSVVAGAGGNGVTVAGGGVGSVGASCGGGAGGTKRGSGATRNGAAGGVGFIEIIYTVPSCVIAGSITCGVNQTAIIAVGPGTYNPPATSCGSSSAGNEVIYSFTPTVSGNYYISQVSTTNPSYYVDYFYKPASGGCSFTSLTCAGRINSFGTSSIAMALTAATTYYIVLDAENGTGENVVFSVLCPIVAPPNDQCANATLISAFPYSSGSSSNFSSTNDAPTVGACDVTGSNIWYKLIGNGNILTASTCDGVTNFDTEIRVFSGACGATMTEVTCNDDDGACSVYGAASTATWCSVTGTDYYISVGYLTNTITGYGNFILRVTQGAYCGPSLLPITFASQNAKCNNNNVIINWTTASEIDNSFFTIERSNDGINFDPIANITGAGNSSSLLNYSYTDYKPLNLNNYYRIRQTNSLGISTAFLIMQTICSDQLSQINIYPNPSTGIFTLSGTAINSNYFVVTPVGEVLLNGKITQDKTELDLSLLKDGVYFVKIETNKKIITKKIMKF